jgi:hypothetical protein
VQREKQAALVKIHMFEQQLNAKPKLELEIEQLEGQLAVMKLMPAGQDTEAKMKIVNLPRGYMQVR